MGMNFWQPNIAAFNEIRDPGLRDRMMDKYLGRWKNGLRLKYQDSERFHQKMVSLLLLPLDIFHTRGYMTDFSDHS